MDTAHFTIAYDGNALSSGSMDVKELAPALLALGDLCEEANRIFNAGRAEVHLEVKADFAPGSFETTLILSQRIYDQVINFFSGPDVTATVNILSLLGITGLGGALSLLKFSKGKKPNRIIQIGDTKVRFDFDEGHFDAPVGVERLFSSLKIRKAFAQVMKPLSTKGIDRFEVRRNAEVLQTVTQEDLPCFSEPEAQDELIEENIRRAVFTIASISFKEGNKWRLSDGSTTLNVTISDEKFLRKVNENTASFCKDDFLILELKTSSYLTMSGLRTEYEAIEILEHKSASRQMSLPFTKPGSPA